MPETKAEKGQVSGSADSQIEDDSAITKLHPDVTQKGQDMIGDFRTDSLHEALARAPIDDDMLMALLVLAFAGSKVRVDSGAGGMLYGGSRFGRHAARLFTDDGGSVTLIRVHRLRQTRRALVSHVGGTAPNAAANDIIDRQIRRRMLVLVPPVGRRQRTSDRQAPRTLSSEPRSTCGGTPARSRRAVPKARQAGCCDCGTGGKAGPLIALSA
jgi:hypothetical protein